MKIRISVTKKIIGMVALPIMVICFAIGIISSNIMRSIITDEIELQLKTGAYGIGQVLQYRTLKDEMNKDIYSLRDYTNIDVTIFSDNIRVASTIDGAVGTEMDSHIYEELQSGEDYFATNANVNGIPYFGYYIPYFVDGEFSGATFTGIPQAEANRTILMTSIKIIACILGYGLVFIVIAVVLVKKMVKGIKELENTIGILFDNDLSVEHEKYGFEHDEIEEINNKIIDFSQHLNKIITTIKGTSRKLKGIASDLNEATKYTSQTSSEISKAVEDISYGAVSQAEETTNATSKINDMSEGLDKIKTNTSDLHSIAESMNNAKNNALNTLEELQKVNQTMATEITSTNNQVNVTSSSVEEIKKAVGMIQDIAEQTKLLSLNASIEAAHAGEAGRGFAVVAVEIGKLASESAQSSKEIEQILIDLVKNYAVIGQNVKNTSDNMTVQNDKLTETQKVFSVLENDINKAIDSISQINVMTEDINKEIKSMVDMISNLSAISEENSAATQETMAAIEEMNATIGQVHQKAKNVDESAEELMKEVNVFKTEQ